MAADTMESMSYAFRFLFAAAALAGSAVCAQPIRLAPRNPHYFEFRGRPTVLVTSGEHYGAVLNPDFDYKAYLDLLSEKGFNLTRVFAGSYCERRGNPNAPADPLSPQPDRFLAPWARSTVDGYDGGGNKFDLDRWDLAYFARLADFCREASRRGIVVEVVLFSAYYRPQYWQISPLNDASNINATGEVPMTEFHSLLHPNLVARQKEMVRKVVSELRDFDNVYFEICNEPYWAKGIPQVDPTIHSQQWPADVMAWQREMSKTISEADAAADGRHLIAMNIANTYYKVEDPDPAVSILNFHYAFPPRAVTDNYGLRRVVAFDETSNGCNAHDRRREAWAFLMAGGAVYDNLDFGFTAGDGAEAGAASRGRRQNCGEVRDQLGAMARFFNQLDFADKQPMAADRFEALPEHVHAYGLAKAGEALAAYLYKDEAADLPHLALDLPKGSYTVEWVDPTDAHVLATVQPEHEGGRLQLDPPAFGDDVALVIRKR